MRELWTQSAEWFIYLEGVLHNSLTKCIEMKFSSTQWRFWDKRLDRGRGCDDWPVYIATDCRRYKHVAVSFDPKQMLSLRGGPFHSIWIWFPISIIPVFRMDCYIREYKPLSFLRRSISFHLDLTQFHQTIFIIDFANFSVMFIYLFP